RIAHVADADVALELEHVMLLEHIAHEPAALAHAELAVAIGGDAGGVLATMLQHGHRIIETLVDGACSDDADDAAHRCFSSSDPHPGLAPVPYRLGAHALAQPVGDRCPVGDEPRLAPPVLVLELEQLPEDHEH